MGTLLDESYQSMENAQNSRALAGKLPSMAQLNGRKLMGLFVWQHDLVLHPALDVSPQA